MGTIRFFDNVQYTATTDNGTKVVTVVSATANHVTHPSWQEGANFFYRMETPDGSQYEIGLGVQGATVDTWTRTGVSLSSAGTFETFPTGPGAVKVSLTVDAGWFTSLCYAMFSGPLGTGQPDPMIYPYDGFFVDPINGHSVTDSWGNHTLGTASDPFNTIQAAVNYAWKFLKAGRFINPGQTYHPVTINLVDGSYNESTWLPQLPPDTQINIVGNTSTPANVTTKAFLSGDNNTGGGSGCYSISGIKFTGATSTPAIYCPFRAPGPFKIAIDHCEFAAIASQPHIHVSNCTLDLSGPITISGGSPAFLRMFYGANVWMDGTITLTGTPAFSSGFVIDGGYGPSLLDADDDYLTFSGSATGKRFDISRNSIIDSHGGTEATFFPGDASGTKISGAQWL